MNTVSKLKPTALDLAGRADVLGKDFATRAEVADETDCFVAEKRCSHECLRTLQGRT